jgi:hypothetical protein
LSLGIGRASCRAGRQLGIAPVWAPEEVNCDDQSSGPGQGREGQGQGLALLLIDSRSGWPCRVELAVKWRNGESCCMSALRSGPSVVERR